MSFQLSLLANVMVTDHYVSCRSTVGESEGLATLNYSAVIIDCFNILWYKINSGAVHHMLILLWYMYISDRGSLLYYHFADFTAIAI